MQEEALPEGVAWLGALSLARRLSLASPSRRPDPVLSPPTHTSAPPPTHLAGTTPGLHLRSRLGLEGLLSDTIAITTKRSHVGLSAGYAHLRRPRPLVVSPNLTCSGVKPRWSSQLPSAVSAGLCGPTTSFHLLPPPSAPPTLCFPAPRPGADPAAPEGSCRGNRA